MGRKIKHKAGLEMTLYKKTKYPCRPWRPHDHKRFEEILDSLKWESCPNGNAGWEDRAQGKFTDAGFVVKEHRTGNPAVMAVTFFDITA